MAWLTWPAAVVLGVLVGAAAAVGALVDRHRAGGRPAERAAEAATLALLGGLLARGLVVLVVNAADDPDRGGLLAGWAFGFVPGVLDLVSMAFGTQVFTRPALLVWIVLVVGALTGLANGAGRIHPWRERGALQFLADVTWGLSGATIGLGLHAVNLVQGRRADDGRTGAHRYAPGFHPPGRSSFAITMGPVMSNVRTGPGAPLFEHERVHVQQHRQFGPFYLITYLLWYLVMAACGGVAGLPGRSTFRTGEAWAYYNNPWETWAYAVQRSCHPQGRDARRAHCPTAWPERQVIVASWVFFAGVGLATAGVLVAVFA